MMGFLLRWIRRRRRHALTSSSPCEFCFILFARVVVYFVLSSGLLFFYYSPQLTGPAERAVLKTEMSISTAEFDNYRRVFFQNFTYLCSSHASPPPHRAQLWPWVLSRALGSALPIAHGSAIPPSKVYLPISRRPYAVVHSSCSIVLIPSSLFHIPRSVFHIFHVPCRCVCDFRLGIMWDGSPVAGNLFLFRFRRVWRHTEVGCVVRPATQLKKNVPH